MEDMGYSNTDAVYENVLSKGLLLKNTKSREPSHKGELVAIPNSTAESVLLYLAHRTRNMDAASDDPSKIPPRYYFGGYDSIVQERGLTQPTPEIAARGFAGEIDLDEYFIRRNDTALGTVSAAMRFLQERGVVKCVRKATSWNQGNSVWILLIGTPEENRKVEHYANRHLEWVRKTKYRPEGFDGMIGETK
ncbi:hypothetical protein ACJ8L7_08935 [Bifidobacterium pseudocatenulatum]|jgi:hypothetical protein|uniref:hypothetical protein n=1 Tax=Bifidobacterium pseudocatenulatum TaxID=28026 RepID=UPI001CFC71A5|nr:hypothetical protein [Bifidobacterium pseudocatenulatum]MCB4912517.1 hypothetical protein [Bifidobacterium pseudocatenulatum]